MANWQRDVTNFHKKFGLPTKTVPEVISVQRGKLRIALILEETGELMQAIRHQDLPEIADAVADAIYVILGTAIEYGIDMNPIWHEVQRTNMAKEGGGMRVDGKILKPKGWEPPKIIKMLQSQGWKSCS